MMLLLLGIAVGVFALDQGSKLLVLATMEEGERIPVLGELLQFFFVRNSGAAFSIASGSTWIFSVVAAVVAVFIVIFATRIRSAAWAVLFGMLLGGTLGNLYDRLFREPGFFVGHVIDFLQLYAFPAIFNLADIAIVSSMGLFIILSFRGVTLDGTRTSRAATDAEAQKPSDGSPSADPSETR
jgi:signal peptidase II